MSQVYTMCEVAKHNGKNGAATWLLIKDVVYDISNFLKEHPGGADSIMEYAGRDASKAFNDIGHSTEAIQQLKLYKIGTLAKECQQFTTVVTAPSRKQSNGICSSSLNGKQPIATMQQPNGDTCCRQQKKKYLFCFYC